jgi:hypothetical protein
MFSGTQKLPAMVQHAQQLQECMVRVDGQLYCWDGPMAWANTISLYERHSNPVHRAAYH